MKRVAIYLRVSTSKQDTDNQRRELMLTFCEVGYKRAQEGRRTKVFPVSTHETN